VLDDASSELFFLVGGEQGGGVDFFEVELES
jgi:hypothetical protein